MLALLDGDYLRYSVGFACEKSIYNLYESEEALLSNARPLVSVRYKKDLDVLAEKYPEGVVEVTKEVDSLINCLHSLKITIQSILANTKATEYRLFLTGGNQFREKVAKTKAYKGNRDRSKKPTYFNQMTDYLVKTWKAEIIEVYEADDMMAALQWQDYEKGKDDTVICTIDKDLNQVPGWHYNIATKKLFMVEPLEAEVFLWKQMLSGDPVDNIQGLPGVGSVKADKMLQGIPLEDMPKFVKEQYVKSYGDNGIDVFNEHYSLIAMKRSLDE